MDTPDPRPGRLGIGVAALAAPPVVLGLWLLVPAWQPAPQRVAGIVQPAQACVGYCRPVVSVGAVTLSCSADLLGLPHACAPRLLQPGAGSATFFRLPTLAGLWGSSPTSGVLIELERDGQVVFRSSVRAQLWAGLYGGWGFHAVYWPLVGLIVWRWPDSRIGRRARRLPPKA